MRPFEPPATGFQAALVTAEVALLAQKRAAAAAAPLELDAPDLSAHLLTRFQGQVCHTSAVFFPPRPWPRHPCSVSGTEPNLRHPVW